MKKQLLTSLTCMLTLAMLKAQPNLVKIIPAASVNFTKVDNKIFFTSHDSLYVTDGTTAGTKFIKSGMNNPGNLTASNGLLYFVVSGKQLWRSNGNSSGTYLLKNFSIGDIQYIQTLGATLLFSARENTTGKELYRSDGTVSGTILIRDINPGGGDGVGNSIYLSYGNYLYFPGTNPTTGTELWRTDGTTSGTILLKDVYPDTTSGFVNGPWAAAGMVYFSANDGTHGVELWKTNGTSAGTQLVKDVNPGTGNGFSSDTILAGGNTIYFFANQSDSAFQLWKSNGTDAGTLLIKEIVVESDYWIKDFLYSLNNVVYFYTYDDQYLKLQLWRSDGTSTGTTLYFSENTVLYGFYNKAIVNGKFYIVMDPNGHSFNLLISDGTTEGTYIDEITRTNEYYLEGFYVVNDYVVVGLEIEGNFLGYYKTNGTYRGEDFLYHGQRAIPSDFTVMGDKAFFVQNVDQDRYGQIDEPDDYRQLVLSDLTNAHFLRSLYGISLAGSDNLFNINGILFFTTYNEYGVSSQDQRVKKLWKFDPSVTTCFSEGGILRQAWNNVSGYYISNIPLDSVVPSITDTINIFEGPLNIADLYGARYRGYLCVPVSGAYTFWIASDDKSELWLSTDALPENKVKIAYVDNFTNSREWNKYPSQQSTSINLVAGRKYYIEALHKENSGRDNLAVGWKLPDGTFERPIPGSRLSPYQNMRPGVSFIHPVNNQTFIAPDYITLEVNAQDWDGNVLNVDLYADNVKLGEGTKVPFSNERYAFTWNTISLGSHLLTAKAYDNEGGVSSTSISVHIQRAVTNNSFTLVNADTDQNIRFISEGEPIFLTNYNINIRYNATQDPGSVKFLLNGAPYTVENVAPYALAGDLNGDYKPWSNVSEGRYTLEAREYSNSGGSGTLLKTSSIHFTVVKPDGNLPPVVNAGPNLTIQLPQNSVTLNGTAYDPDGSIFYASWHLVSAPASIPYNLYSNGEVGTVNYLTVPGIYVFRFTASDNSNLYASDDVNVTVTSPTSFVVSHFTLVNAETDETVYIIQPGHKIEIPTIFNYKLNIVAHTYPSDVGSVHLNFDGFTRTENVTPYSVFGDNNGDYNSAPISAGFHTIVATPYSGFNGTGIQGPPLSVSFNMINPSARISAEQGKSTVVTCFPNPSSGVVSIQIKCEIDGYGKIEIYDAIGRGRETLFEGSVSQGQQLDMNWNGSNEFKGLYFLKTSINDKHETYKIILD